MDVPPDSPMRKWVFVLLLFYYVFTQGSANKCASGFCNRKAAAFLPIPIRSTTLLGLPRSKKSTFL